MPVEHSLDGIETEAARWLLRRDEASWSAVDEVEFSRWMAISAHHRVAYMRLKSVWRQAARLAEAPVPATLSGPARGMRRGFRRPGLAAAAVVLGLSVGALATYFLAFERQSYHTPVGGLAVIPVGDGSNITLNTDSAVRLHISDTERRVDLLRGEAFFDVAKDPGRVFAVYANDRRVVAVGTKFAVRIRDGAVQVSVTEGQVRMEPRSGLAGLQVLGDARPGDAVPLLTPGTVAVAKGEDFVLRRREPREIEQMLGWRSGNVLLQRVALKDAVEEFNRYSHRRIVLGDPALGEIRIGGNFRADNVDGFVRLLQEGFALRAQERDGHIVLTRAPLPAPDARE